MAAIDVGSVDLEKVAAEELVPRDDVDPEHLVKDGLVGGGGFASVWVVTDVRNGRKYALKQLRKGAAANRILGHQAVRTLP